MEVLKSEKQHTRSLFQPTQDGKLENVHKRGLYRVKLHVKDGFTDLPMEPRSMSVAESSSLIL